MANYFAKADTGKTGKIHFMQIFEANNCTLEEEDLEKISELEDDSGEITIIGTLFGIPGFGKQSWLQRVLSTNSMTEG